MEIKLLSFQNYILHYTLYSIKTHYTSNTMFALELTWKTTDLTIILICIEYTVAVFHYCKLIKVPSYVYAEFVLHWAKNSLPAELPDFLMPTLTKLQKHMRAPTQSTQLMYFCCLGFALILMLHQQGVFQWLCRMMAQPIHGIMIR